MAHYSYKRQQSFFAALLSANTEFAHHTKKSLGTRLQWSLNDKTSAMAFAGQLKVPTPIDYQRSVRFDAIDFSRDCVIKPAQGGSGSSGVFVVRRGGEEAHEVRKNEVVGSIDALRKYIFDDQMGEQSKPASYRERPHSGFQVAQRDRWNVEELLIGDHGEVPPRDLKFYMFYGRVGLILEILRAERAQHCFYDASMNPVDTGKYSGDELLAPSSTVASDEYIQIAQLLSENIPSPFARVDLLKTNKGPVFGEITPVPGGSEKINRETDMLLSGMYIEAQARLFADVVKGKRFDYFFEQS